MLRTPMRMLIDGIGYFSDREDDPVVRMAEVEYTKEFTHLQKSLGRRPNREEVQWIITT